jgi:hypothetical protein
MSIIFSGGSDAHRKAISRRVSQGELVKIYPGIYTDEINGNLADIVNLNAWEIASHIAPGGTVSHRTGYNPRVTPEGYFFVTSKSNKKVEMPGVTFVLIKGPAHIEGDKQLGDNNLYQSQFERMLIENLQRERGIKKRLSKEDIEMILEEQLARGSATKLNQIRDRARDISVLLGMEKEFKILDGIIGALLTTHPVSNLGSSAAKARAKGSPYDTNRVKMFESLAIDLDREYLPSYEMTTSDSVWRNFSFFESYFSNYIEGTKFTVEEANEIITSGVAIPAREEDSHDVLGTFKITSDKTGMNETPDSPESLIQLLQSRHSILLKARPAKHPGMFKDRNNQAGAYVFVNHQQVKGTLEKAWKYYDYLQTPVARAYYAMFITTEVHPFDDGNGRIARLMMNSELFAAGLNKILIPNIYRSDYLTALTAMSNNLNSIPLIKMLNRIFEFSSMLSQESFEDMHGFLDSHNAFSDLDNEILRF